MAFGPSAPILTIPQGLLGLLQLKETGTLPGTLGQQVAPNLDLFRLYIERQALSSAGLFGAVPATGSITNAAHGTNGFFVGATQCQVPQNEMWYVVNCDTVLQSNTVAAGDTMTTAVGWVTSTVAGADSYLLTPPTSDLITARARSYYGSPMVSPQFVSPGGLFVLFVYDIGVAAGSYVFNLNMRAARIPI